MKILVADDDVMLTKAMRRQLSLTSHTVVVAHSVAEARAAVEAHPDLELIISDVEMGNETGADLHRWLVDNRPHLAETIIFLTGGIRLASTEAYLKSTGARIYVKPDLGWLDELMGV